MRCVSRSVRWQCYCDGSPAIILFLADRHRDTGELYINGTQVIAAGEIERFPVTAAKRQIGRGRSAVHDAAELFAVWVHDP